MLRGFEASLLGSHGSFILPFLWLLTIFPSVRMLYFERMFDGPVDQDVATSLIEKGPGGFEWPTFGEKNKVMKALP